MKTSIVNLTPELAKLYLARNFSGQRNLMASSVNYLAQQMQSGQWKLNGESLKFDKDGNLIDGQHRCAAVVKSGISIPILIVEGLSKDVNLTIDDGVKRTRGNIMAMRGIANYNTVSSIVMGVMNYRRALGANSGAGGSLNTAIRPSKIDMINEYERHPSEYQHSLHLAKKAKSLAAPSALGIVAALSIIDGEQERDLVDMFYESLSTGLNIGTESPVYKLRERLIKNKGSIARLSSHQLILLTAKAWNIYVLEKPCGVLRLDFDTAIPIL